MTLLRYDPTRTTTLRKKYMGEMRRRFYEVRSLTIKAIVDQDVLGLKKNEPMTFLQQQPILNQLPERQAWRFLTSEQKLTSFRKWLTTQIDENILSVDVKGRPWTAKYVDSAYRKGLIRAYKETHKEAMAESPEFYRGRKSQFLESAFMQGERLNKLQFLFTRSFEELRGITAVMSQQMNRILAAGIGSGLGPRQIARQLSKNVTGITKQRALVLARTEVIAAHAEGQLDSFEELGVEGITVMAEWSTAGDDLVCPICAELEGTIMTVEQARGLIPRHPNCRCAWIPANVGERSDKKMRLARGQIKIKQPKTPKAVPAAPPVSAPTTLLKPPKWRSNWSMRQYADNVESWVGKELPTMKKVAQNATSSQVAGVKKYKNSYRKLNKDLRSGMALSDEYNKTVNAIDDIMVPLSNDVQTFRGIGFQPGSTLDEQFQIGMEFTDLGYSSTSLESGVARKFVTENGGQGAVLQIRIPQGNRAMYLDFQNLGEGTTVVPEMEMLLPRATNFKVVKRVSNGVKEGVDLIELEII